MAEPQDNTPRVWDNRYFSQTQKRDAPPDDIASFESDINLARPETTVGEFYTKFGQDHGKKSAPSRIHEFTRAFSDSLLVDAWEEAFAKAMLKLSLLGLSEDKVAGLVDCTDILRW